jgi:hypothetical protein
VVTSQETDLVLDLVREVVPESGGLFRVTYEPQPLPGP